MNYERVLQLLSALTLLRFFPTGETTLIALAKIVGQMATTEDQVEWLVQRVLNLYNEWPGVLEIRACFCSKFIPRDGINRHSSVYPDGIPSEKPSTPLALPAPRAKLEQITNPESARMTKLLAEASDMNRPQPREPRGIPSPTEPEREPIATVAPPPNPNFKPITQADIDKAVEELHAKRARQDLHGEPQKTD